MHFTPNRGHTLTQVLGRSDGVPFHGESHMVNEHMLPLSSMIVQQDPSFWDTVPLHLFQQRIFPSFFRHS